MKQFAVIGNPIAHSKSPEIHTAFAAQFDIDLSYIKLRADEGKFAPVATGFFERGAGANVTVPFKADALRFADDLSEEARLAGAVNTLSRQGGMIKGDNTDGIGLVTDIQNNHGCAFVNKSVLIIGAGGAARGVMLPIAKANPASITVVNRTHSKAQALAEQFTPYIKIIACPSAALSEPYDIIINATSASLSGEGLNVPDGIFGKQTFAYDMMYGQAPTLFMKTAEAKQALVADGLGMLVEQAAKSFEIWHGILPETRSVMDHIRNTWET